MADAGWVVRGLKYCTRTATSRAVNRAIDLRWYATLSSQKKVKRVSGALKASISRYFSYVAA